MRKYTGAITLNKKISKRSQITGRTCTTLSLKYLEELFKELGGKTINRKKKDLCFGIEILLRYKNLSNKREFFISKI